jgi:ribokinase
MILVFGSVNLDLVVPVARLPLAGETMLGGDYVLLPGGKGANQALAARRAGASVCLAGAVGRDAFAAAALTLLRGSGVDLALVRQTDRPTGCAAIMVDGGGENLIAVASGANALVAAAQVPDDLLGPDTTLLCQMEVPVEETVALIRRARRREARIVLNLAPALPIPPDIWEAIDWAVANQGEAASLGLPAETGRRLRRGLIVTRGAEGAIAHLADGSGLAVPALAVEPLDTTGAGDAFVAVFAAALDARFGVAAALRRASAAAGLACLGRGAQPAMPDEAAIEAALVRVAEAREIPRGGRGRAGA